MHLNSNIQKIRKTVATITENISEYIIQMYRKEDLCRAFDLNLESIGNHIINHLPVSNSEKLAEVNFYEELISKMKAEGIEKEGHLKEVNDLVDELTDFHQNLLKSDQDYKKVFESAKPHVDENLKIAEGKITNEIQICLNGVYGFLLLKLNGKEIKHEDQKMIDGFGDVLSFLSFKYKEKVESN